MLFRATWGLWLCASRRDNKQSRKRTEELTSLAQRLGDESLLLEAQHCRWSDEFFGGNVPQLLETTEEGIRGKWVLRAETKAAEMAAGARLAVRRDQAPARKPAKSGWLARISTPLQRRSWRWTARSPRARPVRSKLAL